MCKWSWGLGLAVEVKYFVSPCPELPTASSLLVACGLSVARKTGRSWERSGMAGHDSCRC